MTTRRRVVRVVFGALVGFIVGAIVAVNFVIAVGFDTGYESTIPEVFDQNLLVGMVTVLILAAGPVLGVIIAMRRPRTGV